MVKRIVTALALLLFVAAAPGLAYETLTTVFVDGIAPMVMDGNLDDWANIPTQEVPVIHPVEKTRDDAKVISAYGDNDCKFSFKCFADRNYVYFAMTVKDDIVLVGRHMYGKGWLDDSNTLYFDGDCIDTEKEYYDINDGQLKVIGNQPSGVKYIEGYIPFFYEGNIPYFWEARGVKSGFKVTEDGYITEIAIPASVLGWDSITAGKIMGANLRVVDKDGDPDDESTDKGYIWAPDPDHTAHFSARSYNRISFATVVPVSGASTQTNQLVQHDGEINITLGIPDVSKSRNIINEVLTDLSKSDFQAAEQKLLPEKNEMWAQPLLGMIQLKEGAIEKGTTQLIDFGYRCPHPWSKEFIKEFLRENVFAFLRVYKGKSVAITVKLNDNYASVMKIFFERYPNETIISNVNLSHLQFTSDFNKSIELHKTMIERSDSLVEKRGVIKSLLFVYRNNKLPDQIIALCNDSINKGIMSNNDPEFEFFLLYQNQ